MEILMLTRLPLSAPDVQVRVRSGILALGLLIAPGALLPANAGGVVNGSCVGGGGAISCAATWGPAGDPYVRTVPVPRTDEERAQYDARDRKWVERCHPVIVQDHYGVARYRYAAPGCEFGVIGE
jgi:hypothetical protein